MLIDISWYKFVAKEYYTRSRPFLKFKNLEYLCWYGSLGSQNDVYNLVAFLGDCPFLDDCVIDVSSKLINFMNIIGFLGCLILEIINIFLLLHIK